MERLQFASDNNAGTCPEAIQAMERANKGYSASYGSDEYTQAASDLIREIFEADCEVFFVTTGTAANSLALASLCESYHSVLCHEYSHVETDECGGPEFFSNGSKILLAKGAHGKVDSASVERLVKRRNDIHYPSPKVLSLTQSTELGTVYKPGELKALSETAHRLGLKVHMDGARFANAVVALKTAPKNITWKAGVDVLCLGGSKNGLALGEAVIFFNKADAAEFGYRCKQAGQLVSKMRFLAAPWVGLLKGGVWLKNARHANQCAEKLRKQLAALPGVKIRHPREANAVYAEFPSKVKEGLKKKGWKFYSFIGDGGSRLMCSWNTSEKDIRDFVADVRKLL